MPIEMGGKNAHNCLTDHGTIDHIHHAIHCQTIGAPGYYQEFATVLQPIAVDYSSLDTFYTKGGA